MNRGKRYAVLCIGFMTVFLCLGILLPVPERVRAAKKSKVSCVVKGDTLTVQGAGALKLENLAASKKEIKKVKKIVVKKGITSIPQYAFFHFKNVKEVEIAGTVKKIWEDALPKTDYLEKVTIPGTFELATEKRERWKEKQKYQDDECPDDTLWWQIRQSLNHNTKIGTICFSSNLSLKTVSWVKSKDLIVSESDPKYRSVDGVIYSKDGESLVRVPSDRDFLSVEEGCEEFCLYAVLYAEQNGNDGYFDKIQSNCERLTKIVLPESIKRVDGKKYAAFTQGPLHLTELDIKTEQLDSESVFALTEAFSNLKEESIYGQMDSISVQDGMYINTNDSGMMRYKGNAAEITIPQGIKKIGAKAFYRSNVKKVILPDTVTRIGPGVFKNCRQLTKLKLSKNITAIPDYALDGCRQLKDIVIPDGVAEIGEYAFASTKCKEIVVPATVKKIGKYVFDATRMKKVTFCGKKTEFDADTFNRCRKTVLYFRTGIKNQKTWLDVTSSGGADRWERIGFEWGKIVGVDGWQIQVCDRKSFRKKIQTYEAGKDKTKMDIENRTIDMRYVRLRPYKRKAGKRLYGRWSVVKV